MRTHAAGIKAMDILKVQEISHTQEKLCRTIIKKCKSIFYRKIHVAEAHLTTKTVVAHGHHALATGRQ
jgi:hypothetical protein